MPTYSVDLTNKQDRALGAMTRRYNTAFKTSLTVTQFFQDRATRFIDTFVKDYEQTVHGRISDKFDALSPAEQQALINQLGVTLP